MHAATRRSDTVRSRRNLRINLESRCGRFVVNASQPRRNVEGEEGEGAVKRHWMGTSLVSLAPKHDVYLDETQEAGANARVEDRKSVV